MRALPLRSSVLVAAPLNHPPPPHRPRVFAWLRACLPIVHEPIISRTELGRVPCGNTRVSLGPLSPRPLPPGNYTWKSPAPLYRVPYILLCTFGRGTMAYGNVQIFLTVRTVTYWIFAAAPCRADIDTPTSQLRKTNLGGYGKLQLRPNSRITQLLVTSNDRQQRHRRGTHHGLPWTVGTKATDSRDLHSSRENQRINK